MRIRQTWPKVLALTMLIATLPHNAFASGEVKDTMERDVIVQPDENPRELGWDTGVLSLALHNPGEIDKVITVNFSASRGQALHSLTIGMNDWTLDLSKYVQQLPSPYPSRIVVVPVPWNGKGKIESFAISLPFWNVAQGQSWQCMTLDLVVKDGRVIDNDRLRARPERCRQ